MKSFEITALFTEPKQSTELPYSWFFSVALHCGVASVLILGFIFNPKIVEPTITPRYTMRLMEIHMPERVTPRLQSAANYPTPLNKPLNASGSKSVAPLAPPNRVVQHAPDSQLLLQLAVTPVPVLTQLVPLPEVILRSATDSPAKLIIPPAPQMETAADVLPTIELPNEEIQLANIRVTSAPSSREALKVLPSTTSPVVVRKPGLINKLPETGSNSAATPTPVTVMSISDLRMTNGIVPLPLANQIASAARPPGSARNGEGTGNGRGQGNIDAKAGNLPPTKRITPAKNGKFGMVVVGASLEDDYPEVVGVWNGRLAYTVYLHVGLAKSWILQYSQLRTSDGPATGSAAHLEAPWPTDMLVPDLNPGSINADAMLAHGFLNAQGRFEKLAIVFPPQLVLAKFVLDTLEQWQFRPAKQNGKAVAVEVLLIIPEVQ